MRGSYIWAGLMTAAIVGWMATGEVIEGGTGDTVAEAAPSATDGPALERVRVRSFDARPREAVLWARGRTEAADRVHVVAETSGLVEEIAISKGDRVNAGDLLCRIEKGAREARLLEEQALLHQTELDYEATLKLSEKGFATAAKLRADKAAMDAARSSLEQMRLDMRRLEIRAPFAGVVEDVPIEKGSLLPIGAQCATIVAMDPMRVIVQISERDIGAVEPGMIGQVELVTGQRAEGPVRYIAPAAEPSTRTFRVELEVPNADSAIRDGVTAEISLTLASTMAHLLPASILTLNDSGEIGVRTIDDDAMVGFVPVTILSDGKDGVWVAGLPPTATIITVGQDFVTAGQKVDAVVETAEAAQ